MQIYQCVEREFFYISTWLDIVGSYQKGQHALYITYKRRELSFILKHYVAIKVNVLQDGEPNWLNFSYISRRIDIKWIGWDLVSRNSPAAGGRSLVSTYSIRRLIYTSVYTYWKCVKSMLRFYIYFILFPVRITFDGRECPPLGTFSFFFAKWQNVASQCHPKATLWFLKNKRRKRYAADIIFKGYNAIPPYIYQPLYYIATICL